MSIRLQFSNLNTGASAQGIRVYRSAAPFTSTTLPAIHAELSADASEYVDASASDFGQTYYYMLAVWRVDAGIEEVVYSSLITAVAFPDTGAGPATVAADKGDFWYGYFGEIAAANFITGDALAAALGVAAGTSMNSTTSWLKFGHMNRALFVSKLPIRHSVSYDQLAAANAIDGTAVIEIGGKTYKARLLQGACVSPAPSVATPASDPIQAHASEWNELMYPVFATTIPSQLVDNWTSNAISALGAYQCWTQEPTDAGKAVVRGGASTLLTYADLATSTIAADVAWRPCLEFVG